MNRKSFLRNAIIAAAISICPKSLLPSFGDIEAEEEKYFIGIIPTIEKYKNRDYVLYAGSEFMTAWENVIKELTKKSRK